MMKAERRRDLFVIPAAVMQNRPANCSLADELCDNQISRLEMHWKWEKSS
jgi:hypothetical protein